VHELGLAAARRTIAGVHAPGLEIATGGDRGDLAIGVLPGQPGLDVVGAPCAEAHVTHAQHDRAVGNAKTLKDALGAAEHAFLLFVRLIGMGDRHHLDLLELVLAEHAGGVAACRARFGPEAQ
jgi:hypothetical protein